MRPIACLWTAYYTGNRRLAEQDAAHLTDVARQIRPAYWVVSPDDFGLEPAPKRTLLQAAEERLLAKQPLAFHSADGAVRIYDVRCLFSPGGIDCTTPPGTLPASYGTKP